MRRKMLNEYCCVVRKCLLGSWVLLALRSGTVKLTLSQRQLNVRRNYKAKADVRVRHVKTNY